METCIDTKAKPVQNAGYQSCAVDGDSLWNTIHRDTKAGRTIRERMPLFQLNVGILPSSLDGKENNWLNVPQLPQATAIICYRLSFCSFLRIKGDPEKRII